MAVFYDSVGVVISLADENRQRNYGKQTSFRTYLPLHSNTGGKTRKTKLTREQCFDMVQSSRRSKDLKGSNLTHDPIKNRIVDIINNVPTK